MNWKYWVQYVVIIFVTLLIIAFIAIKTRATRNDCVQFSGDVVNDTTIPAPSNCVQTAFATVQHVCQGTVEVTANISDGFHIQGGGKSVYTRLNAGDTVSFQNDDFSFVEVWTDTHGFAGLVDYGSVEQCEQPYRTDGRSNQGWGDHEAVIYLVGDSLHIYRVVDDSGVFDFAVHSDDRFPICSVDIRTCVYLLETGEYQVNIIDTDDKTFVIRSDDFTWQNLELEVIEP